MPIPPTSYRPLIRLTIKGKPTVAKIKKPNRSEYPHQIKAIPKLGQPVHSPGTETLNGVKIKMPPSPDTRRTTMVFVPKSRPERTNPQILPWQLVVGKNLVNLDNLAETPPWYFTLTVRHHQNPGYQSSNMNLTMSEMKELHKKLGKAIAWAEDN